ncbi:hypothetical protein LZ32DRAFT_193360 [Colletotrichum eremochloae]|nr:hypothetical protein LZ32DRAFT_193360 [Colletotrichum eremochloae]
MTGGSEKKASKRARYKLFPVHTFTGAIGRGLGIFAGLIHGFEDTIRPYVHLMVYMPSSVRNTCFSHSAITPVFSH